MASHLQGRRNILIELIMITKQYRHSTTKYKTTKQIQIIKSYYKLNPNENKKWLNTQ